jgi:hypothetical protein
MNAIELNMLWRLRNRLCLCPDCVKLLDLRDFILPLCLRDRKCVDICNK